MNGFNRDLKIKQETHLPVYVLHTLHGATLGSAFQLWSFMFNMEIIDKLAAPAAFIPGHSHHISHRNVV